MGTAPNPNSTENLTASELPPEPQARAGSRRWLIALAAGTFLVLGATAAFAYVVIGFAAKSGPGRGQARSIILQQGDDLALLSRRLTEAGLLTQPRLFQIYATFLGARDRLRQGTIMLRDDMTPRELLQRVAAGFGSTVVRVTLPEGYDRFDVADRLAQWGIVDRAAFLTATQDAALLASLGILSATAEGYLFPDTYELRDGSAAEVVLRMLVTTAQRRVQSLLASHGSSTVLTQLGLDIEGVLTLASIVEKEAATEVERPLIAGVFINRLVDPDFSPKRLQADPTVAYGCRVAPHLASCAGFDGKHVRPEMLRDPENPFNTYRHDGLPNGPICNPGLDSIRAVLAPARHRYFYFVASGNGRHRFSETLVEHNEGVEALRQLQ